MRKFFVALFFLLFPLVALGSTAITVTDITQQVFQRDIGGTTADIPLAGTYTGTAPTSIEAQVVNADTHAVVLAYSTLSNATISGGTWTGTLDIVPEGTGPIFYHIQARDGGVTTTTDTNNTNVWGVGVLADISGQSNASFWRYDSLFGADFGYDLTPNASLRYYTGGAWTSTTNLRNGALAFGNTLCENLNIPVGLVFTAMGSVPLMEEGSASYHYINNGPGYTRDSFYDAITTAATALGGKFEFVLWIGSESDWVDTQSNYDGGLAAFVSYLKADLGSSVKIIISSYGSFTESGKNYSNMSGWPIIRDRTMRICDSTAGVYVGAQAYDLPISTNYIHYTNAGYLTHGYRMAQTVLYLLGEAAYCRGPRITGITQVDTQTIDVAIKLYGGTDIQRAAGTSFGATDQIAGFQVFDDSTEETIVSAYRTSATNIRLTISGTITGTASVRHMFDNNPDNVGGLTNAVYDNSGLILPLEPYNSLTTLTTSDDDTIILSYPAIINSTIGGGATVQ